MTRLAQRALLFAPILVATICPCAAGQGIMVAPQFTPGLVLRYKLDVRALHDGDTGGAVENPQGGGRLTVSLAATLKLEVLEPGAGGVPVRATIEQVSVSIGGDTFDPAVTGLERRYRRLEGHSQVFFVSPQNPGRPADAPPAQPGPQPNDAQLEATAQSWMRLLVFGIGAPPAAQPGATWSSEQPLPAAPLKGTVLRANSTYLRDESCGGRAERADVNAHSLAAEACALILTRSLLTQAGSRRDPTPDDYRTRGLRTSGRWEGSGDTLAYFAHRTGWVVSVTETQNEELDFTVSRANGEVILRQRGRVETQANLLLQSVESRQP